MTLKELYLSKQDVCVENLPDGWRESFEKFLWGQSCYMSDDMKLTYGFACDYAQWYRMNEDAITRDIKLNEIL